MSSAVPLSERPSRPPGLNDQDRAVYRSLAAALNVPYVVARGSRVAGHWVDDSDYDVLVPSTRPDLRAVLGEHGASNRIRWDAQVGSGHLVDQWNEAAGRLVMEIVRVT